MMLFVIPVLALVRTTVDSEGTAAVTENSEKSLVRHTDEAQGGKPLWEWWDANAAWIAQNGNKFSFPHDTWLVGIRTNPLGALAAGGFVPDGMHKAPLQDQNFKVKFECTNPPNAIATGMPTPGGAWAFEWWTHERDVLDNPVKSLVKHLEGRNLHILHENEGEYKRPGLAATPPYVYRSNVPVFAGCSGKLALSIEQHVWKNHEVTIFTFGAGEATNVMETTQLGKHVLGFEFTQKCDLYSPKDPGFPSPNCAAGKRGALLMHIKDAPLQGFMKADRVVMYLEDASHA